MYITGINNGLYKYRYKSKLQKKLTVPLCLLVYSIMLSFFQVAVDKYYGSSKLYPLLVFQQISLYRAVPSVIYACMWHCSVHKVIAFVTKICLSGTCFQDKQGRDWD